MEPIKFLLNQTADTKEQVVEAPAFSITKVMQVVAPLLTGVVALATSALETVEFSSTQITALIVALIAFLAITSAADVIARGIATAADKRSSGRHRMLRFVAPLSARLTLPGKDEDVTVLCASDAEPPEYLCLRADKTITWHSQGDITFV